ncbi:hemerythrin family protein [Sulfurimonas sp.]|uniref:bacteriohemerythrin n=1 Tax=Sulfurimonas sp. TaxID=2022749 RepID=UPI0025D4A629|nr:hemerythrin family protein [Sulfurimonas sp.]
MEEQKIAWDDRYAIGIESLDNQHKKLFRLVNRLYEVEEHKITKERLKSILYEFSDYMKTHFHEEEEYMSSIGYDKLQEHKALHQELIDYLASVINKPAKLDIIKTKMKIVAKRALIDHIMNEDTKIKLFLIEQNLEDEIIFDITDIVAGNE